MGSKDVQRSRGEPQHDTRYLEKHQGLWRVVVAAPRPSTGRLKRSLGTASLREAQRLRWPIVAELKASASGAQGTAAAHTDEAEAWRAALAAGDGGPDDPTPYLLHDHLDALRGDPIATEQGEEGPVYIYDSERERRATDFADRAYGRATPLSEHLPAFMASRGELKVDTRRRYTGPMKALAAWLKNNHLPQTIQAIDRRVAIRYVDHLSPGRPDPKRLSLYWQWMVKREHAASDPWRDLSTAPRARLEPERAWTDAEAQALLSGPASPSPGAPDAGVGINRGKVGCCLQYEGGPIRRDNHLPSPKERARIQNHSPPQPLERTSG
jgi:hypothetical protein